MQAETTTHAPPRGSFFPAVANWIGSLGGLIMNWVIAIEDILEFFMRTLAWLVRRKPRGDTLLPNFYQIGVLSLPVVALTGMFIGMVLAVQSHSQFRQLNLETRLGAVINMSLVRELGPVLAATMLAGRVGSAMAAELGTMRVTEQIDALSSMGANPIHYLVVPRFLACLVLIPSLTIMADFMGVAGGYFYSIYILDIDSNHYLENSRNYVGALRPVFRRVQEPVLRRGDRGDQLLSRLPLRSRRRGRGPGRHQRVRDLVRHDPGARLVPGDRAGQYLLAHLARGHEPVLTERRSPCDAQPN